MTWRDLKTFVPKLDSLHTSTGEKFRCLFPGEVIESMPTTKELAGMYPDVPADQREKALHDDLVIAGRIGHEWPAERYEAFGQKNRRDYAAFLLDIGHRMGPCTRHALAELLRTKRARGRPKREQAPLSAIELKQAVGQAVQFLKQAGDAGLTLAQFERRKLDVRRESFRAALERIRFVLDRAEK